MAAPLVFNEYTGWVDVADPQNIPPGTRLITAADLLRYENFLVALRDRANAHETSLLSIVPTVDDLVSDLAAVVAVNTSQASAITTLQNELNAAETDIANKVNRGVSVNSGNVSMVAANKFYVHTGGVATLTLPAFASSVGLDFVVKNRGTGNVTVMGLEPSKMYNTAISNGLTVGPGIYANFVNDGTFWLRV